MNYILFDDSTRNNLLPFTFTRPIADIRIGILTIREKWELYLKHKTSTLTENYLSVKYPINTESENTLINGCILPNSDLMKEINQLRENQALTYKNKIVAINVTNHKIKNIDLNNLQEFKKTETKSSITSLDNIWDIFKKNGECINADFRLIVKGRSSKTISNTNKVISEQNIFIEESAKVECTILNASEGPIYIGKDAEIMEGSIIRGPFALGEHSVVKMGAKIYGPTTIGPYSKVGGEINNSVVLGYSNKAHDGFLGNSVIGEWCNLGADTNNSNLKNNYENVKLWNYDKNKFVDTGLQFCGLFMGDHSKCGINTMFNTGTVVGISSNIFGSGFPRTFIPSFSWGGAQGFTVFQLEKTFEVAKKVMERRNKIFDDIEKKIFSHIFETTRIHRNSF